METKKTTTKKAINKTTKVEAKMAPKKQHANKTGNLVKQQADAKVKATTTKAKAKPKKKAKSEPKKK